MIHLAREVSVRSRGRSPLAEAPFAALYEAQFDRVYAFAYFRTGDAATAEDIAAEVFTRAWSHLRDPSDMNAAVAWLFTTTRRLLVDHYRRRRTDDLASLEESAHPSGRSPELAAVTSERLATLTRCLTDLSDRERDVIGLRFVARLRNRDIGSLVQTSEGNVAKILHRALKKLRERLAAEGYTSDDLEGVTE